MTLTAEQIAALVVQRDVAWATLREYDGPGGVAYANLLAEKLAVEQSLATAKAQIDDLQEQLAACLGEG